MAATASVSSAILKSSARPQLGRYVRFIGEAAFGIVTGLSSLYLLLCHIPITFMGFIKHPLFTWMPKFGQTLQWLYWPTFLLALFYLNRGPEETRAHKLSKYFIGAQVLLGLGTLLPAVVFPETAFPYIAWPLLYGPNLTGASGDISSYIASLICLLPLAWMGIIKCATSFPSWKRSIAADAGPIRICGLSVYLCTAVFVAIFYSVQSAITYKLNPSAFLQETALSLMLHVVVVTAVFVGLQFSDRLTRWTKTPRMAQVAIRGMAAVFLISIIVRKVLLYAIAFNNNRAVLYAWLFALVIVLYSASAVWGRVRPIGDQANSTATTRFDFAFVATQLLILCAGVAVDLFALRLVRFDWNQLIGSLSTLVVWGLVFWFFSRLLRKKSVEYGTAALAFVGIPVGAAFAVLLMLASGAGWSSESGIQQKLEKYSAYDPSLYVLQNVLRPAVNDSSDEDYYKFLNDHANIEGPVAAPDISFVNNFARESSEPQPNVFLFVIDALRRDYLSPYNPRVTFTPNIQRFADESVVFKDPMTVYGGSALAEPAIWTGAQEIHKHYPYPFSRMNALAKMLEADKYHSYIAYDFILTHLVDETSNVTKLRKDYRAWQESEFGKVLLELEQKLVARADPERPVFAYSQPVNVHSLVIGNHSAAIQHPRPGFNDDYAFALETVDHELGQFVQFLKDHKMYENSVVILTADHGESLGDWGRWGHISIAPEIMRIPLIIHLPQKMKKQLVWDTEKPVLLEDITPTIYYLAGHHDIKRGEMLGRPLFTSTLSEQTGKSPDHYFMMSSYMPIFGILTRNEDGLYIVDASLHTTYFYDLRNDPTASENKITTALKRKFESQVRQDLAKIDTFYHR